MCYYRYIEIYEFNVFEFHLASFWRHVEKHWGLSEPSPGSLRQDWGDHHDMSNVPIITHPLIQKMFSGRQGSQRQGRVCKYYHYWKTSCFNTSTKQDLTLHNLPFGGRSVQKVLTFVKTFYTAVNKILFQADVSLSFVRFFEVNFWLAEIYKSFQKKSLKLKSVARWTNNQRNTNTHTLNLWALKSVTSPPSPSPPSPFSDDTAEVATDDGDTLR